MVRGSTLHTVPQPFNALFPVDWTFQMMSKQCQHRRFFSFFNINRQPERDNMQKFSGLMTSSRGFWTNEEELNRTRKNILRWQGYPYSCGFAKNLKVLIHGQGLINHKCLEHGSKELTMEKLEQPSNTAHPKIIMHRATSEENGNTMGKH